MTVFTVAAATQAAGYVHLALGGTLGRFSWPFETAPIGAAVVAYCIVKVLSSEVVRPLLAKQRIDRSCTRRILLDGSIYFIGAGVAVGIAELIGHRTWEVLPVVAVPLALALRTYNDYVRRLHDERRSQEVIDSLDQGMCVVDSSGRVTLWNDALERIAGVTRTIALGDSLVRVMPILAKTELPAAVEQTLKDRRRRTISEVRLSSTAGTRIVQVRMLPVSDGLALVWRDLTEQRAQTTH